jgi:hypothetical protein
MQFKAANNLSTYSPPVVPKFNKIDSAKILIEQYIE